MRIACGIEYDGSHYHGWQRQRNAISVQEVVENAISKVANHSAKSICAGRTDTGVHATAQVIHFDTLAKRENHSWVLGINTNLPRDVSVTWVKIVKEDFHARFSAEERSYRYIIYNRRTRSALLNKRVTWWIKKVEIERMKIAAKYLVGVHDFSSFRAANCQAKSPIRDLRELSISSVGDLIYIDLRANGFLHHMVRNIVGVLLAIGAAEQPEDWVKELLEVRDRTQSGITAPADGLYLTNVRYPQGYSIPQNGYRPVYGDMQTN